MPTSGQTERLQLLPASATGGSDRDPRDCRLDTTAAELLKFRPPLALICTSNNTANYVINKYMIQQYASTLTHRDHYQITNVQTRYYPQWDETTVGP